LRRRRIRLAEADAVLRAELLRDGSLCEGYNPPMADGAEAAWRVLQHAIGSPELQRGCLPPLRDAAPARDPRLGRTNGMDMTRLTAVILLAVVTAPAQLAAQQKEESVRAAAKLTGMTSGMAMACGFDSKPVLHAYRDFLDRKRIFGAERDRLVRVVSAASDRGFATQRQPGAMACPEVGTQLQRAVRRLERAR